MDESAKNFSKWLLVQKLHKGNMSEKQEIAAASNFSI